MQGMYRFIKFTQQYIERFKKSQKRSKKVKRCVNIFKQGSRIELFSKLVVTFFHGSSLKNGLKNTVPAKSILWKSVSTKLVLIDASKLNFKITFCLLIRKSYQQLKSLRYQKLKMKSDCLCKFEKNATSQD